MLLPRQEGVRLREPDFTHNTSEFLIKEKRPMDWTNTSCVLRNVSLTVIVVPWEQRSRVSSCHFLSGLCHSFWTWRSVDSGLLPKLHTLVYVLYWWFLWQINTLWQIKCDFLFLMVLELENEILAFCMELGGSWWEGKYHQLCYDPKPLGDWTGRIQPPGSLFL